MKKAFVLCAFLVAFFVLINGCVVTPPTAQTVIVKDTKEVNVEQMIKSVPLVFYNGCAGAGVLFRSANNKIGCLTAAHVLADGDPTSVTNPLILTYGSQIIHINGYQPGTELLEYTTTAKVVSISPEEDWAVLEIAVEKSGMGFATFSDSLPKIGQSVWSVGSPMFDAGTLSHGIVCHPSRNPTIDKHSLMTFIHTDATGTLGSSGGGLFTDDGVCVGIVARKNPMNGTMYSIPTRTIHESLCQMILTPDIFPPFIE